MTKTDLIKTLEAQRADLTKKIKAEKQKLRRRAQLADQKRAMIIGMLVLKEADKNPELKRTIDTLLNQHVTRNVDRALFDLPPLAGNDNDQVKDQSGNDEEGKN